MAIDDEQFASVSRSPLIPLWLRDADVAVPLPEVHLHIVLLLQDASL